MSYTAYASSSASSTATSSSFGHAYPATIYAHGFPSNCTYYNPAQPKAGLHPLPAQTQIDYKVQLRSRLATGALRDTPEGFPFKVENHAIVCKSFEHYETLPDGAVAAIRFDPPEPHCKYFSWRAYVPTHCDELQRRSTGASYFLYRSLYEIDLPSLPLQPNTPRVKSSSIRMSSTPATASRRPGPPSSFSARSPYPSNSACS